MNGTNGPLKSQRHIYVLQDTACNRVSSAPCIDQHAGVYSWIRPRSQKRALSVQSPLRQESHPSRMRNHPTSGQTAAPRWRTDDQLIVFFPSYDEVEKCTSSSYEGMPSIKGRLKALILNLTFSFKLPPQDVVPLHHASPRDTFWYRISVPVSRTSRLKEPGCLLSRERSYWQLHCCSKNI
jgi:hypothetical protein